MSPLASTPRVPTGDRGGGGRPGLGDRLASTWPLPALMAFVVVLALVVGSSGGEGMTQTLTIALIQLLFVVALYIFVGSSGVLSFGHMAFAAIGAYAAAILTMGTDDKALLVPDLLPVLREAHAAPAVAVVIGGLAAMAAALLLAPALMRLSGIGASLASLAVLVIVNVVANNWVQVTNGSAGFAGVPRTAQTWNVLIWVLIALVVAFAFQRSRWGMRLKASREDEVAAKAIGISVVRERSMAWLLSAFLTGCGGALYAQFLSSVTPEEFFLDATFVIVAMLVIGGTNSLTGAVAGATVVAVSTDLLRHVESGSVAFLPGALQRPGLTEVTLALIMLVILVRRPRGIAGGRELRWPRREVTSVLLPTSTEKLEGE